MRTLIILRGSPASGKSTWLKKQDEDVLKKDIISLRDMFNKESGGDSDE